MTNSEIRDNSESHNSKLKLCYVRKSSGVILGFRSGLPLLAGIAMPRATSLPRVLQGTLRALSCWRRLGVAGGTPAGSDSCCRKLHSRVEALGWPQRDHQKAEGLYGRAIWL